jgi:hypothetical protein
MNCFVRKTFLAQDESMTHFHTKITPKNVLIQYLIKKFKKLKYKNPLHGITENNIYTSFIFLSAGSNTVKLKYPWQMHHPVYWYFLSVEVHSENPVLHIVCQENKIVYCTFPSCLHVELRTDLCTSRSNVNYIFLILH